MAMVLDVAVVCPDLLVTDYLVFWVQTPTSAGRSRPNKRWRRIAQRLGAGTTSNNVLLPAFQPIYGDVVAGNRYWVMVQVIRPSPPGRSRPVWASAIAT
jgi:hypothetical protein